MNPLTGIWPACATVPGYRYASPNGEGYPATIVHCSLYIAHCWNYTFSAKERDAETGLSYFGARYYSSDLSIWLSVDPMAAKYPSTSPYAYCRNNPIRLVDPNGMFDNEAKATRVRNRAARKYGEGRVSDVYNNTIDGGKADYAFSIYGKGKTKYSRSGGTNENGGPVITCDKADKVVTTRKGLRVYNRSQRRSTLDLDFAITAGWQVEKRIRLTERLYLGFTVNLNSVDVIGGNCHIQSGETKFDGYCIDQSNINSNSGVALDPLISYNYNQRVSPGDNISSNHSVSAFFMEIYNSNRNYVDSTNEHNEFVVSYSAAFFI